MMTIARASDLLNKKAIIARVRWQKMVSFNGDYEGIYEVTEQPRSGLISFYGPHHTTAEYAFDQTNQTIAVLHEPADLGIQYLVAMRTMAQEVAER